LIGRQILPDDSSGIKRSSALFL